MSEQLGTEKQSEGMSAGKEDPQTKENGEKPAGEQPSGEKPAEEQPDEKKPVGKRVLLRSLVFALKQHVDRLVEVTQPDLDDKEDVSDICSEAKNAKQAVEKLIYSVTETAKAVQAQSKPDSKIEYQYIAKVRGMQPQHLKDMRNVMQNALGLRTIKFAPIVRNSPFVSVNFISEEIMNKGLKILRNKPLGLTLSVVETKKVEKSRLPRDCVLQPLDNEFDHTVMLKESLLRSRELTEEEYSKMLEWKDKFIKHVLLKMCEKLDSEIYTVVKDRTEGYFFKLEKIIAFDLSATKSERFQTYSGVNPETGKVEMGYWVLGSDVPSRIPRNENIKKLLKVLTDFMESSGKPFYDLRVREGYWDSVMFRSNHVGECMVVLIVRTVGEADTTEDFEALKPKLVELFETGPGKDCEVKSVYVKTLNETGKAGAWHFMHGEEYLDEEVAGLKVRLYMNTLFWSDGGCTEKLCETIAEELALDQETGVLEMGVATGLICMYLAKRCKIVCGLDRVQTVLPLAQKNVDLNELKNIVLVQGTPSTTLTSLKTHFDNCNTVHAVVMETSSNARNKEEILNMRKAQWIKKVVYLMISYKDVTSTLKLMCSKSADSSEPFVITKVYPFDVTSTNVRPDIMLVLERASALEGLTEKRVPKTKPKAGQLGGPPAKKAKLAGGAQAGGQRPRSLLGARKFGGGPLMREPLFSGNRGYAGRNFGQNQHHNQGFMQQRGPMGAWGQSDHSARGPLLPFESEVNQYRLDEESLLLERARRQKEAQIQQMQEAVLEAQRRRLADALLPSPQVPNIEEVVLSAIKKTGLLEKVAALGDTPPKSQGNLDSPRRTADNWSRFNEQQSDDRWSSNYRQQDTGNNTARYQNQTRYQDDSFGYQSRDSSGYQARSSFGSDSGYKRRGGYYS